jgi:hypothetical protein
MDDFLLQDKKISILGAFILTFDQLNQFLMKVQVVQYISVCKLHVFSHSH